MGSRFAAGALAEPELDNFSGYEVVGRVPDDRVVLNVTSSGHTIGRVSRQRLSAMVSGLRRGEHLIVERDDNHQSGDWYVQVWMRDDNTFQLEYRDGSAAEHYQTRTISREKVDAAMAAWAQCDSGWRDPFQWENIGSRFTNDPESSNPEP